jgi:hypothetical protein
MKMDVWAEQLRDQRDDRRAGDEIDHRRLFQQARPHIEVIVFRSVKYRRLLEKRMRDPVARLEQSPHHFLIEGLSHHEEAILIKRLTLLWGELNEFHGFPFSPKSPDSDLMIAPAIMQRSPRRCNIFQHRRHRACLASRSNLERISSE